MDTSSRDIRNRQIARELLSNPNQTYTEIAYKTGIKANFPAQTVYNRLKTQSFKAIMAEEQHKYYDEEKLKRKLDAAIDATRPEQQVHKGYIELGMRSLGMLIDKTVNENHNYNESDVEAMRKQAIEQAMDSIKALDGEQVALATDTDKHA